jgi:ribosomal protein S18 acetylase RimI-like enzyme
MADTGFPRLRRSRARPGNYEGWVVALLPLGRRPAGGGDRSRRRFRLSSEIQIVPRVEADLPQLFGLAKVTFAGMPGWSDERVLEVLKHDVIFVAREKGRPAGYVALRRDDGTIVVEQLFVAPGREGRGIGHQLLAHAEGYAIAERARSLRIVVEDANQQAQSFYRRSGFVPIEAELFELILPRAD